MNILMETKTFQVDKDPEVEEDSKDIADIAGDPDQAIPVSGDILAKSSPQQLPMTRIPLLPLFKPTNVLSFLVCQVVAQR